MTLSSASLRGGAGAARASKVEHNISQSMEELEAVERRHGVRERTVSEHSHSSDSSEVSSAIAPTAAR